MEAQPERVRRQRLPVWVSLSDDGAMILNEQAETVRLIFQLATEGLTPKQVTTRLEGHPTLGEATRWKTKVVRRVLRSRAVVGELELTKLNKRGRRVPCGEPIKDYFPAVIDEATWKKAQSITQRAKHRKK